MRVFFRHNGCMRVLDLRQSYEEKILALQILPVNILIMKLLQMNLQVCGIPVSEAAGRTQLYLGKYLKWAEEFFLSLI